MGTFRWIGNEHVATCGPKSSTLRGVAGVGTRRATHFPAREAPELPGTVRSASVSPSVNKDDDAPQLQGLELEMGDEPRHGHHSIILGEICEPRSRPSARVAASSESWDSLLTEEALAAPSLEAHLRHSVRPPVPYAPLTLHAKAPLSLPDPLLPGTQQVCSPCLVTFLPARSDILWASLGVQGPEEHLSVPYHPAQTLAVNAGVGGSSWWLGGWEQLQVTTCPDPAQRRQELAGGVRESPVSVPCLGGGRRGSHVQVCGGWRSPLGSELLWGGLSPAPALDPWDAQGPPTRAQPGQG